MKLSMARRSGNGDDVAEVAAILVVEFFFRGLLLTGIRHLFSLDMAGWCRLLMQAFAGPSIAAGPKRATGAGRAFIVDALLMGAADDPIGHADA